MRLMRSSRLSGGCQQLVESNWLFAAPLSSGRFSKSTRTEKSYPDSGDTMYGPYSRSRTAWAPYWTSSEKHLICRETRILVLLSGVEMWNVTPSKSETTWSMFAGAPLYAVSLAGCYAGSGGAGRTQRSGP